MTQRKPPPASQLPERILIPNARTVTGAGIGKTIAVPTINVDLSDVPSLLQHGIYACFATIDGKRYSGALHYGPRPTIYAGVALEVHLIDATLADLPPTITISIVGRIRDVQHFPSLDAMKKRIAQDVEIARGMLST